MPALRGATMLGLAALLIPLGVAGPAFADHDLTLPVSQVTLTLPGEPSDWRVTSDEGVDELVRLAPATPMLRLRFVVRADATAACGPALEQAKLDASSPDQARDVEAPAYLPPAWGPRAVEIDDGDEKSAAVCARRHAGGILFGLVNVRQGELASEAGPIRRVLEALLHAVDGPEPTGSPGTPGPGPTAMPSAGAAVAPRALHQPASVVEPSPVSLAGTPLGPPEQRPVAPPDEVDERAADKPLGLGVEVSLFHLGPDDAAFPGTVGVTGGLRGAFDLYDGDEFGLRLHVAGALGYDGDENWLGDVQVGAEPIVRLGTISLSLEGGVGWDTISGSEAEAVFKAPSAIYGFVGGRLEFDIVAAVGLVGGLEQLFRGNDVVDAETRAEGGLRFGCGGPVTCRALFRFSHYAGAAAPGADALGGSFGVAF